MILNKVLEIEWCAFKFHKTPFIRSHHNSAYPIKLEYIQYLQTKYIIYQCPMTPNANLRDFIKNN